MNFVAECTTMSAPCASGWARKGVANVLSTTRDPVVRAPPWPRLEVEDVTLGIAEGLGVERFRVWPNGAAPTLRGRRVVHEGDSMPSLGKV